MREREKERKRERGQARDEKIGTHLRMFLHLSCFFERVCVCVCMCVSSFLNDIRQRQPNALRSLIHTQTQRQTHTVSPCLPPASLLPPPPASCALVIISGALPRRSIRGSRHASVFRCVVLCVSVLQYVAVGCELLQCVALPAMQQLGLYHICTNTLVNENIFYCKTKLDAMHLRLFNTYENTLYFNLHENSIPLIQG